MFTRKDRAGKLFASPRVDTGSGRQRLLRPCVPRLLPHDGLTRLCAIAIGLALILLPGQLVPLARLPSHHPTLLRHASTKYRPRRVRHNL
jgi:hypothetical protein